METLDPRFVGCEVRRAANGAPLWPEALTGSITHTDDFVSAAVARTTDAEALGIDTERIMSESQARQVEDLVASTREVAHGCEAGMSRLEALTLVFSAKESIFKCLHPMTGRYFDFRDVLIDRVDARARTFTARLVQTLSPRFPAEAMFQGGFEVDTPWVHTGVALPSGHNESNYHRRSSDSGNRRVRL
jgi:enterobactin synthetase component D